jgi:hypothetical protein
MRISEARGMAIKLEEEIAETVFETRVGRLRL